MSYRNLLLILLIVSFGACGYSAGGGGSGGIAVTLTPAEGAAGQTLDVVITAGFAQAMQNPEDWSTVFNVTIENSTDNVCNSYTYDSANFITTCHHDALAPNTTYFTLVNWAIGEDGSVNASGALWDTGS